MPKRPTSDDATSSARKNATKRSRPIFRLAPPRSSTPRSSTGGSTPGKTSSRITTLHKLTTGRRGQRRQDSSRLQALLPDIEENQSPIILDDSFDEPDTALDNETSTSKPKLKNKSNARSVRCFPVHRVSTLANVSSGFFQVKLFEWLAYRESFLDELLRHDGLGDFLGSTLCASCGEVDGVIKCRDCLGGCHLRCAVCSIHHHRRLPLHRIEVCSI